MTFKTKDILRMERIKRGLTQKEVAEYLNIAQGSYAKYETGANMPTTESIIKLAQLYHVTTDYLLCCDFRTAMKVSFQQGDQWSEEVIEELDRRKRVRKKKKTPN